MLNEKQKKEMVDDLNGIGSRFVSKMESIWGKGKIGYFFIAMDTATEPTINYSTNIRSHEVARMLRLLADRLEEGEHKIIH